MHGRTFPPHHRDDPRGPEGRRAASSAISARSSNLQVSRKGPADFVSAGRPQGRGDAASEELTRARPGFGWLMEEGGGVEGEDTDRRWIVDPLDGTTNFLHGIPHFAISIALEQDGDAGGRA